MTNSSSNEHGKLSTLYIEIIFTNVEWTSEKRGSTGATQECAVATLLL